MNTLTIHAPVAAIRTTIALPRSKSIANRALITADLAGDRSGIRSLSEAEDTRILASLLQERPPVLHCGLGGTTFRFLLAWAAVQEGEEFLLTGDDALLERPHDVLAAALRTLGAQIETRPEGYRVQGARLPGGTVTFGSPISSQFITALMLIAPRMDKGLRILWEGEQRSRPYVEMTAQVMARYGVEVEVGEAAIQVIPGAYHAVEIEVPPDWSAAAFWYQIVALSQKADVHLDGLHKDGWQGDQCIADLLSQYVNTTPSDSGSLIRSLGIGVDDQSRTFHLQASPDLFQALVFTMAAKGLNATFSGLDNLGSKETDRLHAVADALKHLSVLCEHNASTFSIRPGPGLRIPSDHVFETWGDHRMAMALAPLSLVLGPISITQPEVVNKSYPTFWADLERAGFRLERH